LNEYWEDSERGEIPLIPCSRCEELTFGYQKYCISCGSEQTSRIKRPKETSIQKPISTSFKDSKSMIVIVVLLVLGTVSVAIPFIAIIITQPEIGTSIWWDIVFVIIMFVWPGLLCISAIIFVVDRIYTSRRKSKEEIKEIL